MKILNKYVKCLKLTMKTPEWVIGVVLVSSLLTLNIFHTFFIVSIADFKHVLVCWHCNSSKNSQKSSYYLWHYCAGRKIVGPKSFSNTETKYKRVKATLKQRDGQWKHNLFKTRMIKINTHILSTLSMYGSILHILHKVAYTIK